jgi:hypothetical protein
VVPPIGDLRFTFPKSQIAPKFPQSCPKVSPKFPQSCPKVPKDSPKIAKTIALKIAQKSIPIIDLYFQEFHTRCHRLVICDLLFHKKSPKMVKNITLAIMRPIHTQIQFVHKWIFMRLLLDKKIVYTCMFMFRKQAKVSIDQGD